MTIDPLQVPSPHSEEAEKAILGAMVAYPEEVIDKIADGGCLAKHFFAPAHQTIFGALQAMRQEKSQIDLLTVVNYLKDRKLLDRVGGSAYIADIAGSVISTYTVGTHVKTLKEKFKLREVLSICAHTIYDASQHISKSDTIASHAAAKMLEICQEDHHLSLVPISQAVETTMAHLEIIRKSGGMRGMPTGFDGIDRYTTGFYPGDFVIVAARPRVGKSVFAVQTLRACARAGYAVGMMSLEMSYEQLMLRMIAAECRIPLHIVRDGMPHDNDRQRAYSIAETLSKWPVHFQDVPRMTADEFRIQARRMVASGAQIIIVDYIQLLSGAGEFNRVQEMTTISRTFKSVAMELKIPVLALAQLSRKAEESEEPEQHHLRESGSLEQDADCVILLHRLTATKDQVDRGEYPTKVKITKNRQGREGVTQYLFEGRYQQFRTIDAK